MIDPNEKNLDTWGYVVLKNFHGRKIEFSSLRELNEGIYLEADTIVRRFEGKKDELMRRAEFTPMGIHNAENAMAAVAAVTPIGIEKNSFPNPFTTLYCR